MLEIEIVGNKSPTGSIRESGNDSLILLFNLSRSFWVGNITIVSIYLQTNPLYEQFYGKIPIAILCMNIKNVIIIVNANLRSYPYHL